VVAAVVALAITTAGVVVIASDSDVLGPTSKTTVTKSAQSAAPKTRKTTVVESRERGRAKSRTRTVETQPGKSAQPQEVTTTRQEGERTFLERVLGDVGIVVLQLGVVILAAFVGAALVQRIIVGEYAVEIGSFKLSQLANTSLTALESLRRELTKVNRARVQDAARTKDDLAAAYRRMDLIEKRLRD
jgi:hypothetical protein